MIVYAVFLCKYEYQAPEVADQPSVDAVIAFISRHQDLWHIGQKALQRKFLQVCKKLIFVNVENLKAAKAWILFDHLVSDVHCLVVCVADACLDIWKVQRILPFDKPFTLREASWG